MNWSAPDDRRYTETDEWIMIAGDTAKVGITDYAQDQLSDIVYVELPATGASFATGDIIAIVESVKAAADVHMPLSGVVTEANRDLEDQPDKVNSDPHGDAWFIKVKLHHPSKIDALMDSEAYAHHCAARNN